VPPHKETIAMAELSPSARRVQEVLDALGTRLRVVEHAASTRTADEAAAAVGCAVAAIAKSMIFQGRESGRPVMVIASGANRVDERKVAALLGEKIGRADADYVRAKTGFAIGGVPPVGHAEPPTVLIDADLAALEAIWAAAGTPNAVFRLTPGELVAITGGRVADVKKV
jgi:prolyl-tRNA editing enzyme YbaK/EbsC (Cys-tRNA(Pro) deacylase)